MALESTYTANGSTAIGGEQSYFELPPSGGDEHARQRRGAADGRRHRLLQPAPLRRLLERGPADPVGQRGRRQRPTAISARWARAAWAAPAPASPSSPTTRVTLYNYNPVTQQSSVVVPGGSGNRLVLQLDPGNTLPADDYRVYMPNQVEPGGHRHPDLRHLRQPARRRIPGQPDHRPASPDFPTLAATTRTCSPTAPTARTT